MNDIVMNSSEYDNFCILINNKKEIEKWLTHNLTPSIDLQSRIIVSILFSLSNRCVHLTHKKKLQNNFTGILQQNFRELKTEKEGR